MHSGILPPMVLCLLKGKPGAKMHSAVPPPHDPLLSVTFGMIQTNHCCAVLIAVCARPYNEQQETLLRISTRLGCFFKVTQQWEDLTLDVDATTSSSSPLTYDTHNEWLIRGNE